MSQGKRHQITKKVCDYLRGIGAVRLGQGIGVMGEEDLRHVFQSCAGPLTVTPYGSWVACRFDDVERAKRDLPEGAKARLNPHSGKWNFQDWPWDIPVETALAEFKEAFSQIKSPYDQWKTACPRCGGALVVSEVTFSKTGQKHYPRTRLRSDGFEVLAFDVQADLKDCSTEDEKVVCFGCHKKYELDDLRLEF
jgi:hypothetical protein